MADISAFVHTITICERYTQWVKVCTSRDKRQYFGRLKKRFQHT
jgi:hypothetical protein